MVEPVYLERFEEDTDQVLPPLSNAIRCAQRQKEKLYPKNSLNLRFDWGTIFNVHCYAAHYSNLYILIIGRFVPNVPPNFFRADIVIETRKSYARHLIFATDRQLALLRKAKRWFGDATVYVTPSPFYQLYIRHAFIRVGDLHKQVKILKLQHKN